MRADLNQSRQKFRRGDQVSMEVSEGGVRSRKDFVTEEAELSIVDNKWSYKLNAGGTEWEGGKHFAEASLQFER